jgi:hypothetical protein
MLLPKRRGSIYAAFGISLVVICFAAFGLGVVLLGASSKMAAHIDEQKAQSLSEFYAANHFQMYPEERELRANEIIGLRTRKWALYNIGVSICLIVATLAIPIIRFRLWDIANLKSATTPRTRWRLVVLAGIAWWWLVPASVFEVYDDYAQDDLTWLDGYGPGGGSVIILFGEAPLIIGGWIIATLVCRFVVLRKVNLPVALWDSDYDWNYRSVGLVGFYRVMIGSLIILTACAAIYFKWATPAGLVGIYVLLSSRAGLLNQKVSTKG